MSNKHKLTNLAAQRVTASHTITTLAKKANVSDFTLERAENGEGLEPHVAQRIADALGVSLVTLGDVDL